jgi:hypothetical protein
MGLESALVTSQSFVIALTDASYVQPPMTCGDSELTALPARRSASGEGDTIIGLLSQEHWHVGPGALWTFSPHPVTAWTLPSTQLSYRQWAPDSRRDHRPVRPRVRGGARLLRAVNRTNRRITKSAPARSLKSSGLTRWRRAQPHHSMRGGCAPTSSTR